MKVIYFCLIQSLLALAASSQIVITSPVNATPSNQVGVDSFIMNSTICTSTSLSVCLDISGTGSNYQVDSYSGNVNIVNIIQNNISDPICIQYDAGITFTGIDYLDLVIGNDLGETTNLTIGFYVVGNTLPAQPDLILYGDDTAPLEAVCNVSIPGSWTYISGNCLIEDLNDYSTVVSNLEYGGTLLRWNQANSCGVGTTAYKVIYRFPDNAWDNSGPIQFEGDSVATMNSCMAPAPTLNITSSCGGSIDIDTSEVYLSNSYCKLTSKLGAANSCTYPAPWSFALFGLPTSDRWYEAEELGYRQYENGTCHIYGTVANISNTNAKMLINVWLYDAMTYTEWTSQVFTSSYKSDCDGLGSEHADWTYYKVGYGKAIGLGDLVGTDLTLTQAPSNYYYGFQVGLGADNVSPDFGIGGWISYHGRFFDNATGLTITNANGGGDIAGAATCCENPEIQLTYSATDECGNTATGTQIVDVIDLTPPQLMNEPPSLNIACAEGFIPWVSQWGDDCSTTIVTNSDAAGLNSYHYMQTATDVCGNSTTLDLIQPLLSGDCTVLGCTDPVACNYSPIATTDDGSCYTLTVNVGNDTTICLGQSIDLIAIADPIIIEPTAYLWTPAESISGLGNTVVATPTTSTTYTIEVTDANGCIATDDIQILINPTCTEGCTDPNATNYDPLAQLEDGSCTYELGILIFNDLNADGIHQANEPGLPYWPVEMQGSQAIIYSNQYGFVNLPFMSGNYNINLINNSLVWSNTTPTTITVTLPSDLNGLFGLVATGATESTAQVYQGYWDVIHCETGFDGGIHIMNTGAGSITGLISLSCDPILLPEQDGFYTIGPDLAIPGYAEWTIDDFTAGSSALFSFHIDSPGLAYLGENFDFAFTVTLYNDLGEEIYSDAWTINRTVSCAYDPNDLTANPVGLYDPHYILPGQRIDFRVRFENQGNAPAEDIIVMDEIDASVYDLSTFEPLYASHPVSICLHDDGMIDLIFENINLPSSNQNSEQSHGFGVFQISARADLVPGTVLLNDAAIFFDQNPAVLTNEVYHTIFDCDSFVGINGDLEVCEGETISLNAEQDYVDTYNWSIDDVESSNSSEMIISDLSEGIHNVELITGNPLCSMTHTATVEIFGYPSSIVSQAGNVLTAIEGVSWQWYLNDNVIPSSTDQSIIVSEDGVYSAIITGEGGCQTQSESVTIVNITELRSNNIAAYPNPFTSQTTLTLPDGVFEVLIYDFAGGIVYRRSSCTGNLILNREQLATGPYRVVAKNGEHQYFATLIIH